MSAEPSAELFTPRNYRDVLEPLWRVRPRSQIGRVLDIGSNTTWLAQFIDDYWGIDVDAPLVKRARDYWTVRGRWDRAEAERRIIHTAPTNSSLPQADQVFDLVVMRDVLEHVPFALELYAQACRVLKHGGLLLLSCPDSQPHVWDEASHLRPYPLKAQRHLASFNGMDIVYAGHESVARGTQVIAGTFGGRTPAPVRVLWHLPFWPRNAVTIHRKR